ncbi:MAG: Rab family GTPase [Aliiglaciecola sp.]|uniref:Rab family GTPase n=1 Tax=Aliiglaciecola sp. M165 TaxID=2593649 RepID=UPI00117FC0A3|nr:Rab family GTPase [Aliiglaciecola sp. M165]TRY33801.1 GTP-binding protein [Aliiglaciecola sp. M165]
MIQKKICLLGASGVGKTSLVKQYVEGIFSEKYLTTIGVKIDKKQVDLGVEQVQLMLWDIEGIDRYCGFQPKYLRGASAYIIVTDQTRSQSLVEGMEIHRMAREVSDVPSLLVINKCDLEVAWHWTEGELNGYSKEFVGCFTTSAKTGEQVDDLFKCLAQISLK